MSFFLAKPLDLRIDYASGRNAKMNTNMKQMRIVK